MLLNNFRDAAAICGKYFSEESELRVRQGRKTYRFMLKGQKLFFVAPGQPEQLALISSDATVAELKKFILSLVDRKKEPRLRSTYLEEVDGLESTTA